MANSSKKPRRSAATNVAIVATIFSVPMMGLPIDSMADKRATDSIAAVGASKTPMKWAQIYLKMTDRFTIMGLDNSHTIYKKSNGEMFYVDPQTGDMRTVSSDTYMKFKFVDIHMKTQSAKMVKLDGIKYGGQVSLVGIDPAGHAVQKNSRGEMFYLDNNTGDMVPVK